MSWRDSRPAGKASVGKQCELTEETVYNGVILGAAAEIERPEVREPVEEENEICTWHFRRELSNIPCGACKEDNINCDFHRCGSSCEVDRADVAGDNLGS